MPLRFFMAALMIFLAGCQSVPPISGDGLNVVQTDALPTPQLSDRMAPKREYYVGPFDKIQIDVFGVEELNKEVQVDGGGEFAFPLIGTVQAGGRTPADVANEVESRLRGTYLHDPQVAVNVVESVSQLVTIDGEVKKPGLYPAVGNMTLMRAIATAGGTAEYAKLDDVIIFREVGGERYAGVYNLQGIRRGNYADPDVYVNDVIVVGDSPRRRLIENILANSTLITTPLFLLLR